MGDELETREKLLESAMAEFSENGYMKASLRKICADAGVTTVRCISSLKIKMTCSRLLSMSR